MTPRARDARTLALHTTIARIDFARGILAQVHAAAMKMHGEQDASLVKQRYAAVEQLAALQREQEAVGAEKRT